jgi:uncharacterized membrane protein YphA (DoxX/SURF4 family)
MVGSPRYLGAWILSLVLAVAFVIVGLANVTLQPQMVRRFTAFGYPLWFVVVTGAIELFGAVLVLIPATAYIGAGLLAAITLGALISQFAHGATHFVLIPVLLFFIAITVGTLRGWGRAAPE